ncbi:hypothetical protein EMIHUDRAFT_436247, partial [Emiliania huxleyi CCMP1516]
PKYSPFYSGVFVASAAASAGAERAGFSARCPRRVHATRSSRRTADRCAAQGGSEGCERGRGSGAHRLAPGAAVTSRSGAVGGSSAEASRSAAPPTAPLPSRRVEASRGRCRWCRWCGGGEGSSAGSESDRHERRGGGCRRPVWLTADPAPGGGGEPRTIVAGGGGAAAAARPSLQPRLRSRRRPPCTYHTLPSRHPAQGGVGRAVGAGAAAVHRVRARRLCAPRCGARRAWRSVWCVERRVLWGCLSFVLAAATACSFGVCVTWHWFLPVFLDV